MKFAQCCFSLCSAGAWCLLEMGMVCAKGYGSGNVLHAICVRVCWRVLAKIREILFSLLYLGSDPTGPKALRAALQELRGEVKPLSPKPNNYKQAT